MLKTCSPVAMLTAILLLAGCGADSDPASPSTQQTGSDVDSLKQEVSRLRTRVNDLSTKRELSAPTNTNNISDDTLVAMINCGDAEVMRAAAQAARKRSSPRCQQALLALARARDRAWGLRSVGVDGLRENFSPEVIELWKYILSNAADEPEYAVSTVAEILGQMRNPENVPLLLETYRKIPWLDGTQNPSQARVSIIRALGWIADPRALPVLKDALKSPASYTRHSAIEALRNIRDESTADVLLQELERLPRPKPGDDSSTYRTLLDTLSSMGDKRVASWLVAELKSPDFQMLDVAYRNLPRVAGNDSLPAIQQAIKREIAGEIVGDNQSAGRLILLVRALGAVANVESARILLEAIKGGLRESAAREAAQFLPQLCKPDLCDELIAAHKSVRDSSCRIAIEKILRSGDYPALYIEQDKCFIKALPEK